MLKKLIKWDSACYILIAIFIFVTIIGGGASDMDELWNFSAALNIKRGLIPYKDFNIIVTPLSFWLSSIPLMIFGEKLIVFKIFRAFMLCVLLWVFKKIFDRLKINNTASCLWIFAWSILLTDNTIYEYNFLQIILLFLIIYFEIGKTKKDGLLAPLIVGLTLINKQSTGAVITFTYVVLLLVRKFYLKEKISVQQIIQRLLIMIIPGCIFLVYLLITGSLPYFYDLCIAGLKTFDNVSVNICYVSTCAVLMVLGFVLWLVQRKNTKSVVFLFYSVAGMSAIIPIVNKFHFIAAILPIIFYLWYFVNDFINLDRRWIKWFLCIVAILLSGFATYRYVSTQKDGDGIYSGLAIGNNNKKDLLEIDNFILKSPKKVYILDYVAVFYMLPIGRYNKNFDLYMKGNFGIEGRDNFIRQIKEEDCIILISKDENRNWQEPLEITELVRNTYHQKGEVEGFYIYEKV